MLHGCQLMAAAAPGPPGLGTERTRRRRALRKARLAALLAAAPCTPPARARGRSRSRTPPAATARPARPANEGSCDSKGLSEIGKVIEEAGEFADVGRDVREPVGVKNAFDDVAAVTGPDAEVEKMIAAHGERVNVENAFVDVATMTEPDAEIGKVIVAHGERVNVENAFVDVATMTEPDGGIEEMIEEAGQLAYEYSDDDEAREESESEEQEEGDYEYSDGEEAQAEIRDAVFDAMQCWVGDAISVNQLRYEVGQVVRLTPSEFAAALDFWAAMGVVRVSGTRVFKVKGFTNERD